MEERSQPHTTLQLISQPAFLVDNGIISQVNQAAETYLLQAGQPFAPMILHGAAEYADFQSGKLMLTLNIAQQPVDACVYSMEAGHIVVLSQQDQLPHLQALARAAVELKDPLSAMLSLVQQPSAADSRQQAQMNRRLFQMLRIVTNMSDAAAYAHAQQGWMESIEVGIFIKEILDKAAIAIAQCGIQLDYELPQAPIFTLADREKLERAMYNLLSNACKYTAENASIHVKVSCKNKRVSISVTNRHGGNETHGNFFDGFMLQPSHKEQRNGVGLGMVFVRAAAAAHGGAVLIDQREDSIRFTLTLQVQSGTSDMVRSPIMYFDYAGELDHCLLELAEVLPAELYRTDNIL